MTGWRPGVPPAGDPDSLEAEQAMDELEQIRQQAKVVALCLAAAAAILIVCYLRFHR